MIKKKCNSFNILSKPMCCSLMLMAFLFLYSVVNHSVFAAEQVAVEDKKQEVSEGGWLQQQIRHFRSYPRLDRAYRFLKSGKFEEAAKEFKQYLTLNPNDVDVQLSYITVLYQLKKYQLVISTTTQLLNQHPNHYKALKYQAYAYQHLKRFESARKLLNQMKTHPQATLEDQKRIFHTLIDLFLAQENYSLALRKFNEYLTMYPQDNVTRLRYSRVLYQQKKYDLVVDVTKQLLKQQPNHYEALKYQAYAYRHLNRFDKAIPLIKRVGAHEQGTFEDRKFALDSLIELFLKQENQVQALQTIERYLNVFPNDLEMQLRHIVVLYQMKQYQHVIRAADRLLERHPDYYTALKYQAYAYQGLKKETELLSILDLISNHPQATETERQHYMNMRIDQLVAQKQYSQALQAYENGLNNPKDFTYYYRLGNIYHALKQEKKAISAYENAYQQATQTQNKFKALMQLGFFAKKHKYWRKAENYFTSALSLQSNNVLAMREVANIAYQQKKYDVAISWLRKVLKRQEHPQDRELLANALYQEKQYFQAIESYQKLFLKNPDKQSQYRLRMKMGYAYFYIDEINKATFEFSKAVHLAQSNTQQYNAHIALGYLERLSQNWQSALASYQAALHLNASSIIAMWGIADIAQKQKNYKTAIEWFTKVLSLDPEPKVKNRLAYVHQVFGLSLYQQKKWRLALKQFKAASEIQQNSRIFLYTAFTYKQLGKRIQAEKYIHKALSNPEQLTGIELGMLYKELGQFHVSVGEYRDALNAFLTSLDYFDEIEVRLNVANLYRLTGEVNQAQQMLENMDESALEPALKLNYFNQLALVYAEQQQYQKAINALLSAEELQPTAEQQYQLGLYYTKLGDLEKTLYYLKQANLNQPTNSQYAASLGYLYMAQERYDRAIQLFEGIAEREPDFPNLYQDLGYAETLNKNNDAAIHWFKKGIDQQTAKLNKNITKQQQKEAQQKIDIMKSEVSKLADHYQFSLYQMYRSNNDSHDSGISPTFGNSAMPSQGGLNITYQPHKVGYRDGRVLQLFARMLWNTQSQTLQVESESLQGGIGFRYKPFKEHALFLGIEKLFKVGENAIDDWLVRTQYSWYKKFEADESTSDHYYLSIYGDLTFFSGETYDRSFSWEANFGKKIRVASNLFVSPHLIANGSYQEPDTYNGSYTEAGAGLSMQTLFGGSQYEADTSSAELRLQYKKNIEKGDAGLTMTGVLNY